MIDGHYDYEYKSVNNLPILSSPLDDTTAAIDRMAISCGRPGGALDKAILARLSITRRSLAARPVSLDPVYMLVEA